MEPSIKKGILDELKQVVRQRGEATKQQRAYFLVEEHTMLEMYPMPKPSEEKRFSHLRTLDKYIGETAAVKIMESRRFILSAQVNLSLN